MSDNIWIIHNMHGPTVYQGTDLAKGLRKLAYLMTTNGGRYQLEFENQLFLLNEEGEA